MPVRIFGTGALCCVGLAAAAIAIAGTHTIVVQAPLIPALTLAYGCIDLARPFLLSLGIIAVAVAVWSYQRGEAFDGLRLAIFAATMAGVLLAQSVVAFLLAWESMALASLFLVGTHGSVPFVRRALISYGLVSQLGAVAIAIALVILGSHAPSFRFDDVVSAATNLPETARNAVLLLALIGFGSKAGLVPLHFWLPRAHPAAPANASALLSGAMLNVALYALMLVVLALAAPVPAAWGIAIVALGGASGVAGALLAVVETDVKRLLAYSSIENVGIVAMALGVAIVASASNAASIAALALVAATFHAFNHGIFKSALFLGAGTLGQCAGTTDLEHLGGLFRVLPFTTAGVLVASMAAAALPPASGFASEWLVFRALVDAIASHAFALRVCAAVALAALALTGGLAAVAFAKLVGIGFLGTRRSTHGITRERFDAGALALLALAGAVTVTGVLPALLVRPLTALGSIASAAPIDLGSLPILPVLAGALPLAGAMVTLALSRKDLVRRAPVWTCGSPVVHGMAYTAAAFSNPVRRIFGEDAVEEVRRDAGRMLAAAVHRLSRRLRIVQSGLLRVYLLYAATAVVVVLLVAR